MSAPVRTFVNHSDSGTANLTCTVGTAEAGNVLIACVEIHSSGTITSWTENTGNWTFRHNPTGVNHRGKCAILSKTADGSDDDFDLSWTGVSEQSDVLILEYDDLDAAGFIGADNDGAATTTAVTSKTTPVINITGQPATYIGYRLFDDSRQPDDDTYTFTKGTLAGVSEQNQSSSRPLIVAGYQDITATGNADETIGWDGSAIGDVAAIAWKKAAAAPEGEWDLDGATPQEIAGGLDGNVATRLTATATSHVIKGSVFTAASATHAMRFWARLFTSGDTVEYSMDGGSTYVDITSSLNDTSYVLNEKEQVLSDPQIYVRWTTEIGNQLDWGNAEIHDDETLANLVDVPPIISGDTPHTIYAEGGVEQKGAWEPDADWEYIAGETDITLTGVTPPDWNKEWFGPELLATPLISFGTNGDYADGAISLDHLEYAFSAEGIFASGKTYVVEYQGSGKAATREYSGGAYRASASLPLSFVVSGDGTQDRVQAYVNESGQSASLTGVSVREVLV